MRVSELKQTPFYFYMKSSQKIFLLSLIVFGSCNFLLAQSGRFISLKQKTEILENKNKLTSDIDIFFNNDKLILTKYYHSSPSYIIITNALGEIKTYYPSRNEVTYKQLSEMSTKRNLIYYFANNLTDHLGLADEGYQLVSNFFENQYYVTNWKAPAIQNINGNVKMVFDNGLPIYSEHKINDKEIVRKIYYLNYNNFTQFRLPSKIIEINYLPKGDSIISRTVFSDVKVSSSPDNSFFNFKIPEDAKPFVLGENN